MCKIPTPTFLAVPLIGSFFFFFLLDTIMRKMTNNKITMSYFKRRGYRIRLQLAVDRVFVKTNTRFLSCVYVAL